MADNFPSVFVSRPPLYFSHMFFCISTFPWSIQCFFLVQTFFCSAHIYTSFKLAQLKFLQFARDSWQDETCNVLSEQSRFILFKAVLAHPVPFFICEVFPGFCNFLDNICFGTFLARLAKVCSLRCSALLCLDLFRCRTVESCGLMLVVYSGRWGECPPPPICHPSPPTLGRGPGGCFCSHLATTPSTTNPTSLLKIAHFTEMLLHPGLCSSTCASHPSLFTSSLFSAVATQTPF